MVGKNFISHIPLRSLRYIFYVSSFLDFPGMCFASTKCATVEPGKTWDLYPFCGRSTCVVSEDQPPRLLELVEDCGPLPLANDKCKLDEGMTIFSQKHTLYEPKSNNLFQQKKPTKLHHSHSAVQNSNVKTEPNWNILKFLPLPQFQKTLLRLSLLPPLSLLKIKPNW